MKKWSIVTIALLLMTAACLLLSTAMAEDAHEHNYYLSDTYLETDSAEDNGDGSHTINRVYVYTCAGCGETYQRVQEQVHKHLFYTDESLEQKQMITACVYCGAENTCTHEGAISYFANNPRYDMVYTDNGNGTNHTVTLKYSDPVALKCETCGQIIAFDVQENVSYIEKHDDGFYSESETYTCICGAELTNPLNGHEHQWLHREEKAWDREVDLGDCHQIVYHMVEYDYCPICHDIINEVHHEEVLTEKAPHIYYMNATLCTICNHENTACLHLNMQYEDLAKGDIIVTRDNGDGTHSQIPAQFLSGARYTCPDCGATIRGESDPYDGYTYMEDRATVGYHTYGDDGTCTVCGAVRPDSTLPVPVVTPDGEITTLVNGSFSIHVAGGVCGYDYLDIEFNDGETTEIVTWDVGLAPGEDIDLGVMRSTPGTFRMRFRGWLGDEVSDWSDETILTVTQKGVLESIVIQHKPRRITRGDTVHFTWNDPRIDGQGLTGYDVYLYKYDIDNRTRDFIESWHLEGSDHPCEIDLVLDYAPGGYEVAVIPQTEPGYRYIEQEYDYDLLTILPKINLSSNTWVQGYEVLIEADTAGMLVEWAEDWDGDDENFHRLGYTSGFTFRPPVSGTYYIRVIVKRENGFDWTDTEPFQIDILSDVVTLPADLTTIESQAFADMGVKAFLLPAGITSIAADAFDPASVLIVPDEATAQLVKALGYQYLME